MKLVAPEAEARVLDLLAQFRRANWSEFQADLIARNCGLEEPEAAAMLAELAAAAGALVQAQRCLCPKCKGIHRTWIEEQDSPLGFLEDCGAGCGAEFPCLSSSVFFVYSVALGFSEWLRARAARTPRGRPSGFASGEIARARAVVAA